ncbi:F0F1 ATP synthase subunit B family protein [Desulfonema magnum]|uniref:ATP synthase subunit b n=1 Tax=Desulfonema magnum TaxID=45655 RepID=A0A975GTL3_9BACT|nr:ATP synthase F0 subunit B [Desulfonema magnum]QTA93206.1 ATP synthase, subunit beta (ATP synthase F0 sector subunit b) [Desulfonema magnum]
MKRAVIICLMVSVLFFFSGAALGSGGDEGHGAEPKGWIATDTYRVMNFAVLAIALFLILRKPVSQALDARIRGIREQLSELEVRKKDAETELAQYNKKLLLLEQETEKIVAEYIKQGNEAKERILREAESAAEKLEVQASRNIENEFERAKLQLQQDILEKALIKAEQVVKQRITDKDQERLVDEYLEKVVA